MHFYNLCIGSIFLAPPISWARGFLFSYWRERASGPLCFRVLSVAVTCIPEAADQAGDPSVLSVELALIIIESLDPS